MTEPSNAKSGRREFLYITAGAAALGLSWIDICLGDEVVSPRGRLKTAAKKAWALGSEISITALHANAAVAAAAIDDAFAELRLVERLMSIYQADSQLSRLNRERVLEQPHPYFVEVLRAAANMSRRSGGAFDITVQPLWSLFAAAKKQQQLPDDEQIDAARRLVDWRKVEVTPERIRLHGQATITLNGIAQGYAADQAEAALRKRGVAHALINTGEINALGFKVGGDAWTVGVQHPRREDAYISLAALAGRCLATSGDYATSFSDDHRNNHLFDPRTGRSPSELSSVSVAAPTALLADALSTAAIVLGVDKGIKLVESIDGADALLVTKNGETRSTAGFPFAS